MVNTCVDCDLYVTLFFTACQGTNYFYNSGQNSAFKLAWMALGTWSDNFVLFQRKGEKLTLDFLSIDIQGMVRWRKAV